MSELEGEIKFSNASARTGRILATNGTFYNFSFAEIVTTPRPEFLSGLRVRFRLEDGTPRLIQILTPPTTAASVGSTATPAAATEPATATAAPGRARAVRSRGAYRFLNPYNFVRFFERPRPAAEASILGSAPPPPHNRYIGLSGVIRCELTATTPLFVSDSHGVNIDERGHQVFRFFRQPDGTPAIPGTSLRGVIRSVFEAATNSCLVNFHGDKRLSYRPPPGEALKLVPARVVVRPDRSWALEILEGTTTFTPDQRPTMQYAAWVRRYRPMWANNTAAKQPGTPYAERNTITDTDLAGLTHGSACQAVVRKIRHPAKNFEFWNVERIAPLDKPLAPPGPGERLIKHGYLCITNQNIENKHDERLFFTENPRPIVIDLEPDPEAPEDRRVRRRYRELILDYQERHADDVKKAGAHPEKPRGKRAGFSRFVINQEDAKLSEGDLVYAMIDAKGRTYTVRYIVPVSVPRVTYDQRIGDLLPEELQASLQRCTHYDTLCPACRTFGWVWEGDPHNERDRRDRTAYAGRVRISHAVLEQSTGTFDATLAILSTPKPTTTRFYLAPERGRPQDNRDDKDYNYDTPRMRLRGRKFYRHHGAQFHEQEYMSPGGSKSDQNRTIRDAQQSGSRFSFEVRFENLAPLELGALLWALEIDGRHHRIGYGKPLGFGSAQITVEGLAILDPDARYQDLASSGLRDALDLKSQWVRDFKAEMGRIYGSAFEELPPLRDLDALLSEPALPVHYPRSDVHPLPDGRNYEWFVGNKRSGRESGPRLVLRISDEDTEGLPIIDRFGQSA